MFLYICTFSYSTILLEHAVRLVGNDPYYHVRRIWLTVLDYPWVPFFDNYLSYPEGFNVHWPVGFTLFLATISKIFLGSGASLYEVGKVSAVVVPFVGLLNIFLIYIVGSRWYGRNAGLLAALLAALTPALIHPSKIGRVDHHMLEPFFTMLVLYLFERAYTSGKRSGYLLCGASVSLAFLFIPAANLLPFLLAGLIVIKGGYNLLKKTHDPRLARASLNTFLWMFVFIVPVAMTSPFAWAGNFEFERLSLFQPLMIFFMLCGICLFWLAAFFVAEKKASLKYLLFGAAAVALLLFASPLSGPLHKAFSLLTRENPKEMFTSETQPFWTGDLRASLELYSFYYTYFFYLLPLIVFWSAYRLRKDPSLRSQSMVYWLVLSLALAFMQRRLIHMSAMPFVLVVSLFLNESLLWVNSKVSLNKALRQLASFAAIALVFAMVLPSVRHVANSGLAYLEKPTIKMAMLFDTLIWLKQNTPKTSFLTEPGKKPEYAVLASWEMGHYLTFYSERPNVANPFGMGNEMADVARLYTETDEEKAYSQVSKLGAKYILLGEECMASQFFIMGGDPEEMLVPVSPDNKNANRKANKRQYLSMAVRLYYLNGSAMSISNYNIDGLGHFRLLYESKHDANINVTSGGTLSYSKIFEVVPGATITGTAAPQSEVSAQVPIRTNRGRTFTYHIRTRSDSKGRYSLRLAFPTIDSPYETAATGSYTLSSNGNSLKFDITEREIQEGASREANLI